MALHKFVLIDYQCVCLSARQPRFGDFFHTFSYLSAVCHLCFYFTPSRRHSASIVRLLQCQIYIVSICMS